MRRALKLSVLLLVLALSTSRFDAPRLVDLMEITRCAITSDDRIVCRTETHKYGAEWSFGR